MEILLCEVRVVNKNPRYRIIKYKNDYLMIDLVSTWLVLFFPFINWLIPKKYVQISREDFDNLNIVKPVKNKALWPAIGSILLFGTMFRDKIYIPDSHLEKKLRYYHLFGFIIKYSSVLYIFKSESKVIYL
ncbi:membrane spanning protein [Staphylococcus aureus]|nr:membrane spanning protein [Staphylococcus aureus]CPD89343.1 membrane spanning protein [Staphylococcus aureus]